jgi:hypothetical protein
MNGNFLKELTTLLNVIVDPKYVLEIIHILDKGL